MNSDSSSKKTFKMSYRCSLRSYCFDERQGIVAAGCHLWNSSGSMNADCRRRFFDYGRLSEGLNPHDRDLQ